MQVVLTLVIMGILKNIVQREYGMTIHTLLRDLEWRLKEYYQFFQKHFYDIGSFIYYNYFTPSPRLCSAAIFVRSFVLRLRAGARTGKGMNF